MSIDTAKATDRRTLAFHSVEDVIADVDRIVDAEQRGTLRCTGNWSAGQVFGHLATWINYAYEGYPFHVPWFIRLLLKFKVKQYLRGRMDAGVRIPNMPDGTLGTEPLDTAEGARRLRAALQRLKSEPAKYHSPAFGTMSHEDRILLNLRHAELHMSFMHPG